MCPDREILLGGGVMKSQATGTGTPAFSKTLISFSAVSISLESLKKWSTLVGETSLFLAASSGLK